MTRMGFRSSMLNHCLADEICSPISYRCWPLETTVAAHRTRCRCSHPSLHNRDILQQAALSSGCKALYFVPDRSGSLDVLHDQLGTQPATVFIDIELVGRQHLPA